MNSSNYNETVISAILSRHSVRAFTDEAVTQEAMQKILACAFAAPSAMNKQSWFISVVDNRGLIDEMSEEIIQGALKQPAYAKIMASRENFHAFYRAPLVLMISGETDDRSSKVNSGILLQNVLLAAEAVGLGACPIGFARFLFEEDATTAKYKKQLAIPETHSPVLAVAIGKVAPQWESKPDYPLDWQSVHGQNVAFIR